ncbi:MAG: hypothetical protein ACE5HO_21075 [bacterium]
MKLLLNISSFSILIPVFLGIFFFRRLAKDLKVFLLYLVFSLLVEIINFYLSLKDISNIWVFHFYTLAEYSLLVWVFSFWQKRTELRRILRTSVIGFALIWLTAKLFIEDLSSFDSFTASLEGILLVGISAYTLYELSKDEASIIYKVPRFWIASAILIYFTGNMMILAFGNTIITEMEKAWTIQWIVNILTNLCYTGGFLCLQRRRKSFGLS